MNSEYKISASEAEAFAGVSLSTLMRFAEAGYFSVEEDSSGSTFFQQDEICKLFNLPLPEKKTTKAEPQETEAKTETGSNFSLTQDKDPVGRSMADYESVASFKSSPKDLEFENNSVEQIDDQSLTLDTLDDQQDHNAESETYSELESVSFEIDKPLDHKDPDVENLILEVQKLQRVIELQEQLLESRESEIADLKEQRSWLKERLEKSEDKADRDQLLLISEMQMLTKLIAQQQKKSFMNMTLEWLGFKTEQDTPKNDNTIDYQELKARREANKKHDKVA